MKKAIPNVVSHWPGCPVCLGHPLEQWDLQQDQQFLQVHHCPQCSGMWLDLDGLWALRSTPLEAWRNAIPFHYDTFLSCCRHCGHRHARRARSCAHCHVPQVLQCVICQRALETHFVGGIQQDHCPVGHGLWLDHIAWIQCWDLPDALFTDVPRAHKANWKIATSQRPTRHHQNSWRKNLSKTDLQRLRSQGFESQIGADTLSTFAVSKGSLGVVGWLAKGSLKIGFTVGRTLGRFFFGLAD